MANNITEPSKKEILAFKDLKIPNIFQFTDNDDIVRNVYYMCAAAASGVWVGSVVCLNSGTIDFPEEYRPVRLVDEITIKSSQILES